MFQVGGKKVLVEGVSKDNVTITPGANGDGSGAFMPIAILGTCSVFGKSCVKSPLAFTMVGCKHGTGSVGMGGGSIGTKQKLVTNGVKYLLVDDQGQCKGAMVGGPGQYTGPCNCTFKIKKSGQKASSTSPPVTITQKNGGKGLKLQYLDARGTGVPRAKYSVKTEDGTFFEGTFDSSGIAELKSLPNACRVATLSIFGDPERLTLFDEFKTVENRLRSEVKQEWQKVHRSGQESAAAGAREDVADESDLQFSDPPEKLSLSDWVYGVVLGDFNESPTIDQTIARTVVTLIPVVDQIGDLQDLTAAFYHLAWKEQWDEPFQWLNLGLTLVGCFPEIGTALKGVFKILVKGVGDKFPQIVRFLNAISKKGNAVRWLRDRLKQMGEIKDWVFKKLDELLNAIIEKLKLWHGQVLGLLSKAFKQLVQKVKTVGTRAKKYLADVMDDLKNKLTAALGKKSSRRLEMKVGVEGEITVKQMATPRVLRPAKKRGALPKRAAKIVLTRLQREIAAETRLILYSPKMTKLRAAQANGEDIIVIIGRRRVQYVPNMPGAYGMSDHLGRGFYLSPHAFSSQKELTTTIIHELYRLRTSATKLHGVGGDLAAAETAAAWDFAPKLYELGWKAGLW